VSKVVYSLSASEAVPGFDIKVALKEITIESKDDSHRMASITNVSLMNHFCHYIGIAFSICLLQELSIGYNFALSLYFFIKLSNYIAYYNTQ